MADPEPERGGERGRGPGTGVGGQWLGTEPPPTRPRPRPPLPLHSEHRPRPGAPPLRPWGSLSGTTVSRLEHSPAPHSLWLEVLPPKLSLAASPSPTRETAAYPRAPRVSRGPLRRPPPLTPYPGLGNAPHRSLSQAQAMAGGWAPSTREKGGALCGPGDEAG